jgi:hypothetical protein
MDLILRQIESECKSTIGFKEAENKESFMVGVNVAISKTTEHYEKEIDKLKMLIKSLKSSSEYYRNDLETLSDIINRHSTKD